MSKFSRPHHKLIEKLISQLNPNILEEADCFFAGGTAISLQLKEYRESVDVDFLCASNSGYRLLRNLGNGDRNLGELFLSDVTYARDVLRDQYGIRTVIVIDEKPIKFEIVSEGRIQLSGSMDPVLKIPALDQESLFAEKLLANTDRGSDASVLSRDIIDLGFMINSWGNIPESSWAKAFSAYGESVSTAWKRSLEKINDKNYFLKCLTEMDINLSQGKKIKKTLQAETVQVYNPVLHKPKQPIP